MKIIEDCFLTMEYEKLFSRELIIAVLTLISVEYFDSTAYKVKLHNRNKLFCKTRCHWLN